MLLLGKNWLTRFTVLYIYIYIYIFKKVISILKDGVLLYTLYNTLLIQNKNNLKYIILLKLYIHTNTHTQLNIKKEIKYIFFKNSFYYKQTER
jgi:hypothetical protein